MEAATTTYNHLTKYGFKSLRGSFMPHWDMTLPCLSERHLNYNTSNRQEPCFESHPGNKPAQISADTHKHMDKAVNEGEIYRAKENLQRVVGWDD